MEVFSPPRKRRKVSQDTAVQLHTQSDSSRLPFHEAVQKEHDFWSNCALYAIDDITPLPDDETELVYDVGHTSGLANLQKRNSTSLAWEVTISRPDSQEQGFFSESPPEGNIWQLFPELFPSVPLPENRIVDVSISNPFLEDAVVRHPTLRPQQSIPEDGALNGYIKIRFRFSRDDAASHSRAQNTAYGQSSLGVHHKDRHVIPEEYVPSLPPNFGRGFQLDSMDSKLLKFYLTAFCGGRTLLSKSNFWLCDLAPIADKNELVSHAVLALAAAYVLDYRPIPKLQNRANFHYKKAVELMGDALRDPQSQEVGKDDPIVSALILLLSDDVVNWELRRSKDREQRWFEGARVARRILDASDPGYRYYNPENVQASNARISNANWIAYVDIIAQPVMPLEIDQTDSTYGWLLEGTETEVRKIHGATGVCPKLLHTYAQITRFAARMNESPDSMILPHGARKLEARLTNFHQWSDLSPGYNTADELLTSCVLDTNGQVNCPAKITELTGETWVAAAQIYLQCRVFRRPRSHPAVRDSLNILLRCVERMPYSGPLFTSQSPFFPIFIMGIVSYIEEDRKVVRDWFENVLLGVGCRSSVPPVWEALKSLWEWIDTELIEDANDFDGPIGQRTPWWEQMVDRLTTTSGLLSLA
ncbi:hypothetical protein N431DRAFT_461797 [Stipitochalara longipes BDJ]|nr:hypothetical protein N431DRAFT_461797 [Stipitochalara longipes BDJ]